MERRNLSSFKHSREVWQYIHLVNTEVNNQIRFKKLQNLQEEKVIPRIKKFLDVNIESDPMFFIAHGSKDDFIILEDDTYRLYGYKRILNLTIPLPFTDLIKEKTRILGMKHIPDIKFINTLEVKYFNSWKAPITGLEKKPSNWLTTNFPELRPYLTMDIGDMKLNKANFIRDEVLLNESGYFDKEQLAKDVEAINTITMLAFL